jgi:hypothetical protein
MSQDSFGTNKNIPGPDIQKHNEMKFTIRTKRKNGKIKDLVLLIISPVDQQIPLRHAHRRNRKETVFCTIHLKSLEPHPAVHKEQSSQGQVPSKEKTAHHKCSSRSDPIRSISANMQPAGERKKRRDMLTMICSSPSDPVPFLPVPRPTPSMIPRPKRVSFS